MGLFSIFRRNKVELKGNVAFVGLGFSGKSTILNRLKTENFKEETLRTMGLNVDSFEYNGVKFSAFDLGGQETFRLIWEPYVANAIAICYIIDSSAHELFPESAKVLKDVLRYAQEKAILLILANKSDLAGSDTLNEIIKTFDFLNLQETAKLSRINMFNISAKTGDQFDDAFEWLAQSVTDSIKNASTTNKIVDLKEKNMHELKNSLGI